MELREFYGIVGGDYETVLENMISEQMAFKFIDMFLEDPSYQRLLTALECGEDEEAFKAVHTLKGVSANLGLMNLYQKAVLVTEELRNGRNPMQARAYMPQLTKEYEETIQAILKLQKEK